MSFFQMFMELPHFWIIFILSFLATLLTTVIYKFATDQKRLKEIKSSLKDLRKKQKDVKGDSKKLMALQKEMMELNMEMMKQSFKSMLYTFIPLILLFSWMSANIAYEPINPGEEFAVTARISNSYIHDLKNISLDILPEGSASLNEAYTPSRESRREIQWLVSSPREGMHTLVISSPTFNETKEVLITESNKYVNPIKDIKGSQLLRVEVGNDVVRPLGDLSIFGLRFNWLWTYILLSIAFSVGLRKLFRVS
ncbi:MAG: EMC3/TMCO1 family protein [Candidatus Woesearchaeota archaeon]